MDTQLAQLITLVGHGNSFLSGSVHTNAPDLERSGSTFQFVSRLKFTHNATLLAPLGTEIAGTPGQWLETLRSEGATRLWYIAFAWKRQDLPEHIALGFSGAVPRAIQVDYSQVDYSQVDYPTRHELWYPIWTLGDRSNPERRIWNVEYKGKPADHSYAMTPDLAPLLPALQESLASAAQFAREIGDWASNWVRVFALASEMLTSADPQRLDGIPMLPPDGYSLPARRLLAAASHASVFGGMGSWNDLGVAPSQQAEYDRVTQALQEAVKLSLVAAANSFDPKLVARDK
jgi:hypothetical protein